MSHTAHTSTPIHPVLAERWSPRAYDSAATLTATDLTAAFEAARWAPSAMNGQPWRFIVGFRGDATFDAIVNTLAGWNGAWAPNASALVVAVAQTSSEEGQQNPFAIYDLGQAVASFTFQAHSEGLYVHQMAGTDTAALAEAFNLPAGFEAFHTFAVGKLADPSTLPDELAAREVAPRTRHELTEIVRYTPFEAN